jgi:hypothetical protein
MKLEGDPRMWMVTVYLFLVSALLYFKPPMIFDNKRVREFGTGRRGTTVFPLWWWIFLLAAASYLIVHTLTQV